jgi:hypothetical protein
VPSATLQLEISITSCLETRRRRNNFFMFVLFYFFS